MAERSWGEKLNLILWIILDSLKRFFTENTLLKLISLAIALFMWFSLSTQEERDRTLENVPLKVVNRRQDTVVTNVPLKVVDIRVRGPLSLVTDLDPGKMSAVIDASGLEPGSHSIWLSPDQVNTPANVEVLRIDPPNIPVIVEPRITRQVSVKPQIKQNSVPPGYVVLESTVVPSTVELTGPASKVSGVTELMTNPVDLSAVGSQGAFTVSLIVPDQSMKPTPSAVRTTFTLDRLGEKRLTELKPTLPQRVLNRSVPTMSVLLEGPQSLLDKIGPNDIIVKLDVAKLPRGEHEVSPAIELPKQYRDTVRVTSIEPEKLVIRLR